MKKLVVIAGIVSQKSPAPIKSKVVTGFPWCSQTNENTPRKILRENWKNLLSYWKTISLDHKEEASECLKIFKQYKMTN
jgi:hypothetical protein